MEIPKAIEILNTLLDEGPQFPPGYRRKAVKLGIEAMERDNLNRLFNNHPDQALLPSETTE